MKVKIITIVIGVVVIMGIFGLGVLSATKEINDEKSFAVNEINEIRVNLKSESINIYGTEAGNEVKFRLHGESKDEIKLVTKIKNSTLAVERSKGIIVGIYLDIYIPKNYVKNLSIKTFAGSVKMDSVNLANFTFNTFSGATEIKNSNAIKLFVKSFSGPAQVAYEKFEDQNIHIETFSGSIRLELPRTAEFLINAKTKSGRLQSDFSIGTAGSVQKSIEGQIGNKDNKVSLQAGSGSITIVKK